MTNCILCNEKLIVHDFYYTCTNNTAQNKHEYTRNQYSHSIQNESIVIFYVFLNDTSTFLLKNEPFTSFKKEGGFKVINSSVKDTYYHYYKLRIFS